MDPLRASYEAVLYDSKPIPTAEPDTIAAAGILHGLEPAAPDRCRVLELGCGSGGNVIASAFRLPRSRFVGIDFAPTAIEVAKVVAAEMGLQNVAFDVRSIADVTAQDGMFDYIICHGVYSWVPPEIQDAILRVCSANLAPNGLAFVSYNTLPGWRRRGMLREMLLFHDVPSLSPAERIARAREFAGLLSTIGSGDSPHDAILREEAAKLAEQTDYHLFHEQLEPWNEPLYFAEFARRAAGHGLRYVAESKIPEEAPAVRRMREALPPGTDPLRVEQYTDYAVGRMFRRSVLCHQALSPSSEPLASGVRRLFIIGRGEPVAPSAEDAARGPGVESFRAPQGGTVTTNNPLVNATLHTLADSAPAAVAFDDLARRATERLASTLPSATVDADTLASVLLQLAAGGLVEFRALPSRFVHRGGARPKASGLARWQALRFDVVSSLGHWPHRITAMERFILPMVDGERDRGDLLREIQRAFAAGELNVSGGTPSTDQLRDIVADILESLGRGALLTA